VSIEEEFFRQMESADHKEMRELFYSVERFSVGLINNEAGHQRLPVIEPDILRVILHVPYGSDDEVFHSFAVLGGLPCCSGV